MPSASPPRRRVCGRWARRSASAPGISPDARRVIGVCSRRGALSIAEIAAYLDLPPSVVKILASDLLDSGHLVLPAPAEPMPELALLEEVLNGLRALAV